MLYEPDELYEREVEARAKETDKWNSLAEDHCRLGYENEQLREAIVELLSGHDNLYRAHFGEDSNPEDDIAAKAARLMVDRSFARKTDNQGREHV